MEWELPNGNGMGVLTAFLLASGTDITIFIMPMAMLLMGL